MGPPSVLRLFAVGLATEFSTTTVIAPAIAAASPSESCSVSGIGLGLEHGNWMNDASYSGKSLAQVFLAPDLPIRSITVWRQRNDFINQVPMHLYVGTVRPDSPLEPEATSILLDGPVLVLDGTSDVPRPVRFELDPPLALPGAGRYFFALKEDWCGGIAPLVADSRSAYGDGDAWLIHPFPGCGGALGHTVENLNGIDLIFQVEFCDTAVPAGSVSWGRIKATYR